MFVTNCKTVSFSVMKDALRVRQVLASSHKSTGGSFTELVAAMGVPKSASTGRRKTGTAIQRLQDESSTCSPIRLATNRFQVETSSSEGEKASSPLKGNFILKKVHLMMAESDFKIFSGMSHFSQKFSLRSQIVKRKCFWMMTHSSPHSWLESVI